MRKWRQESCVQAAFTLLSNAHLRGFLNGRIYQGPLKQICVPGLNCYSCPGALGACPIGSLQAALFDSSQIFPFYVTGLLLFFGMLLGRVVCGWLCPFGLLQDLLAKIPLRKWQPEQWRPPLDHGLRRVKYANLLLLVGLLPFLGRFFRLFAVPWFCKTICPSGTITAGWPLVALNPSLQGLVGLIFGWKSLLAILIIYLVIRIPRFFCRYLCPLGAFYSLFHRLSLIQLLYQPSPCIHCHRCRTACPMGIAMPEQSNSPECIRCGRCTEVCPVHCLKLGRGAGKAAERDAFKL